MCREKTRPLSEHMQLEKSNLKEILLTTEIHGAGSIAKVITPPPGGNCRMSSRKLVCLVIIKKQVVQFIP